MSTQQTTATITWHELYTTDVERASKFYADLFGGDTTTHGEYTMVRANGREQFGFAKNDQPGVPSHWYPYVRVGDVDATTARAQELGAQVYHGPVTYEDMLTFAVLGDPQGATFGVIQPLGEEGDDGERMVAWNELLTTDRDAAFSFYGELFGWTTAPFGSEEYHLFNAGETVVGGVMKKPDEMRAPTWLVYFGADVDATAKRGEELGATVLNPPTSMESVGRFAVLADPTGAAFGLHQSE